MIPLPRLIPSIKGISSIPSVDPTFNCSDFYVTPINIEDFSVVDRKRGNRHTKLVATLVHFKKDYATYFLLPSGLYAHNPQFNVIVAFSTDKELALINSFLMYLNDSGIHLLCYLHFKEMVQRKLFELKLPECVSSIINDDIFHEVSNRPCRL